MKKINYILALIVITLALIFYFWGNAFSDDAKQWPQFFSITLVILSILLIIDTTIKPDREKETDQNNNEIKPKIYDTKVFYTVGLLLMYVLIMGSLGFLLTTPIFLALLLWFINYRSLGKLITISLGTTVGLVVVFQFILGVPIPQGVLENLF